MNRSTLLILSALTLGASSLVAQAAPAAAPARSAGRPAAANVVRVRMTQNGARYMFEPAAITVKQGDIVEFVNVSGGPHNVAFEAAKIPAGAAAVLNTSMANKMSPLMGPLLTTPNQAYRVSFAGAPVGTYEVFCMPHKAMGMKATITVQASTGRR
jgi:plastocyanin